jgi:hypothetical protein
MTAQIFRISCKGDGQHIRQSVDQRPRDRPIVRSCKHGTLNLLLANFTTLEKQFRPAGHCFVDTGPAKRVHDVANHSAEFALSRCSLLAFRVLSHAPNNQVAYGAKRTLDGSHDRLALSKMTLTGQMQLTDSESEASRESRECRAR